MNAKILESMQSMEDSFRSLEGKLLAEESRHARTREEFAELGCRVEDLEESLWFHRLVIVLLLLVCILLGVVACW